MSKKIFGDDQLKDRVSQKFQTLIIEMSLRLVAETRMGQRLRQQKRIAKFVTDSFFERIHLPCYSEPIRRISQYSSRNCQVWVAHSLSAMCGRRASRCRPSRRLAMESSDLLADSLPLLINLERCDQIERALQHDIVQGRLLRALPPALRHFGCIQFGIRAGEQARPRSVRSLRFVNERLHSFLGTALKNLALIHHRHLDGQIRIDPVRK